MAQLTPNMNLTVWNLLTDPYNYEQLADNFIKIDQHDHSGSGKGSPINGATGIIAGTIGKNQLGPNSVTTAAIEKDSIDSESIRKDAVTEDKIRDYSITTDKISRGAVTNAKIGQGEITIDKIAGNLIPDWQTVVPTGADDKDEVYYAHDAANSTIWHLRYRQEVDRWEFVGGPPHRGHQTKSRTISTGVKSDSSADMAAIAKIKLFPGRYLFSFLVHYNATILAEGDNPQVRAGIFTTKAHTLTTGEDPYYTIPASQRTLVEHTKQSDKIDSPNFQGTLQGSFVATTHNATNPIQLFVGKNKNVTSADFTRGIITATPIYLTT
jgi:hypothetical protein